MGEGKLGRREFTTQKKQNKQINKTKNQSQESLGEVVVPETRMVSENLKSYELLVGRFNNFLYVKIRSWGDRNCVCGVGG